MSDELVDPTPRRRVGQVDAVRGSVVVACFLIALLLLLGPASRLTASPTTRTTAPGHHHHHHKPTKVVKSLTHVAVVNASGRQGAAGLMTVTLNQANWNMLPATTSLGATHKFTNVYFTPGFQQAALDVARAIGVPRKRVSLRTLAVEHVVSSSAAHFDVVVLLGQDLAK